MSEPLTGGDLWIMNQAGLEAVEEMMSEPLTPGREGLRFWIAQNPDIPHPVAMSLASLLDDLERAERERDEARAEEVAALRRVGLAEEGLRAAGAKLARIVKALEQWYWPDAPGSLRHRHVEQVIAEALSIAKGDQ